MSHIRKRFERLVNNPKDVKWDEVIPILHYYGCAVESPSSGSHWIVYHPAAEDNLSIPVHNNRVKKVYIDKIIMLIETVSEGESGWKKI